MKYFIFLFMFVLTGCTGSPPMLLVAQQHREADIDGQHYIINIMDIRGEVIRRGPWVSPGQEPAIRARMIDLVPTLTGCTLWEPSVQGTTRFLHGRVLCPQPKMRTGRS